ncbi:MAG: hypothetical protein AAGC57_18510 [Pseudomonadota bacterium]
MVNAKNLCAAKKLKEELRCRKVILSVFAALIGVAAVTPAPVQAAEIDCKVILCLAGGFPAGCSDAHSYMIRRITARPPKPPFGICHTVSLDGDREVYSGATTRMYTKEASRRCVQFSAPDRENDLPPRCLAWEVTYHANIDITVQADPVYASSFTWNSWTVRETQGGNDR